MSLLPTPLTLSTPPTSPLDVTEEQNAGITAAEDVALISRLIAAENISTQATRFDNEISFMYKQVIAKQVPFRYLLVETGERDFEKWNVITVQDFMSVKVNLLDAWSDFKKINKGDTGLSALEFLAIWFMQNPGDEQAFLATLPDKDNPNDLRKFITLDKLEESSLDNLVERFVDEFNEDLSDDLRTALSIIESQKQIADIEPLDSSYLHIKTASLQIDIPTEIGNNKLPEFFDRAVLSPTVPFISYCLSAENNDRWYKIHEASKKVLEPPIILDNHTLYLMVSWNDTDLDEPDEYQTIKIGYHEGFLRVHMVSDFNGDLASTTTVWERLRKVIPELPDYGSISNDRIVQDNIVGNFFVHGLYVYDQLLMNLIINDDLFSNFIYVDEASKSQAARDKFTVKMRGRESGGKAPLVANIHQEQITAGKPFFIGNESVTAHENLFTVRVEISYAQSVGTANSFQEVLTRLLADYFNRQGSLEDEALYYVPTYETVLNNLKYKKATTTGEYVEEIPETVDDDGNFIFDKNTSLTLNKRLRLYAGDMYPSNSARNLCQHGRQPLLVPESEVEVWENIIPEGSGLAKRQVYAFPKYRSKEWLDQHNNERAPEDYYYFVCPDDKRSYIGARFNRLENKDRYPMVLCCYGVNHSSNPNSKLRRWEKGTLVRETEEIADDTKKNYVLSSYTAASPDILGAIPAIIRDYLVTLTDYNYYRYGVPKGPDSFLFAVLEAVMPEDYRAIRSESIVARCEYVKQLRQKLHDLPKSFYSQETSVPPASPPAGNTCDQSQPLEKDTYFDPLLYTPLVEKYFGIRIFLFNIPNPKKRNFEPYSLQVPKAQYFRAETPVTEEQLSHTVLILTNWGKVANMLEYPQNELIIAQEVEAETLGEEAAVEKIRMFGADIGRPLQDAYLYMARTLHIDKLSSATAGARAASTSRAAAAVVGAGKLVMRNNQYKSLDYGEIFGDTIIGQGYDNAGKVQLLQLSLNFPAPTTAGADTIVAAPEEAPMTTTKKVSVMIMPADSIPDVPEVAGITREVSLTEAKGVFGAPPSGVSINRDGLVDAVWFAIGDIPYAVAIYVAPSRYQGDIPQVPDDVILFQPSHVSGIKESSLRVYKRLVRSKNVISQLVKYLYVIDRFPDRIKEWLTGLTAGWPERVRTNKEFNYNSSGFPRVLPYRDNITAVQVLTDIVDIPYIKNGKLLIESKPMFNALVYQLNKFRLDTVGIKRDYFINRYREIDNYYSSLDDFRATPDLLLLSDRQLEAWIHKNIPSPTTTQRQLQITENNVNFHIDAQSFSLQQPFVYQESGSSLIHSSLDPSRDRFYLIQNVAAGPYGLERALRVASVWAIEHRNLGYKVDYNALTLTVPVPLGVGTRPAQPTQQVLVHKIYILNVIGELDLYADNSSGRPNFLKILMYPDQTSFAALLPLNSPSS